MTINEAIRTVDAIKSNPYSEREKIKWLSILDGTIKEEIIDTHNGGEYIQFYGYDEYTPLDTELLVQAPYDDIYTMWLCARIDYANGETNKFNGSISMFNASYAQFKNYYNRNHLSKTSDIKYF